MDLKERYTQLFEEMIASKDVKNMKLFGSVMNDLMKRAIESDQKFAEQEIDKLEAMKWEQYLTKQEAEQICNSLDPKCQWDFNTWENAINSLGLEEERKSVFNKYALWTLMNSIYSDHSNILQGLVDSSITNMNNGISIGQNSQEKMIQVIHSLALNYLLDKDKKFDIRKYFLY